MQAYYECDNQLGIGDYQVQTADLVYAKWIHNVSFYFSNQRETNERYAILGETYFKAKERNSEWHKPWTMLKLKLENFLPQTYATQHALVS